MYRGIVYIAALLAASPAVSQFVEPSETDVPACNERRNLSDPFFDTLDFREAHRSTLIQRMRTAQAFTKIVEDGDCSCETRFPDWQASIQYYLDQYALIEDRHEIYARTRYYESITNERRQEARAICVEQDNW